MISCRFNMALLWSCTHSPLFLCSAFHFLWDMSVCAVFIPLNPSKVTHESDIRLHCVKWRDLHFVFHSGVCEPPYHFVISFMRCAFFPSIEDNKSKLNRVFPFELLMFAVSRVIFQKKAEKNCSVRIYFILSHDLMIGTNAVYSMERFNSKIKRLPHTLIWMGVYVAKDTPSLDVIVPLNMRL